MENYHVKDPEQVRFGVLCLSLVLIASLVGFGCSSCVDRSKPARAPGAKHPPSAIEPGTATQSPPAQRVRTPAVAGSWYPGDRQELERYVDGVLAQAEPVKVSGNVLALISPHAGYRFSGKAAATGFKLLQGQDVRRVIVLAVAHRAKVSGASIADVTHYETPLGLIPVDQAAVSRLRQLRVVGSVARAHEQEHSLEIQLPLLQRVLPSFSLVPLLIGHLEPQDYKDLAAALAQIVDRQTVVVASSDFTHRGPNYSYELPPGPGSLQERLTRLDRGSIDRILRRDRVGLLAYQQKTGSTICGLSPIAVLLELLSGIKGVKGTVLSHYTSGDVLKDWTNTVTYVDVAFTGQWLERPRLNQARSAGEGRFPLSAEEKQTLLTLARSVLDASVSRGRYDEGVLKGMAISPSLRRKAGAFVTLKCRRGLSGRCTGKGEDLRGCMGIIQPAFSVVEAVAQRSATAALADPRFHHVAPDELKHITVEVSVLTPPRRVNRVEEIIIGRHGIILDKDGRSATFLPQVAPEQGWDRPMTLSHLSRKAGLEPDGWREGANFAVYEAIVFSEGEHH